MDALMAAGRIGRYDILEKLGEGGMGVVYKARDVQLDRIVALKVLAPEKTGDPEFERMFAQEAKAASALNHPNIVTIYGVENVDGTGVLAMEYAAGETLDRLIGAKGIGVAKAVAYAVQIADGICAAHAAGIVHRDLKPGNIVVTDKGQIKILDFGLAKLARARPASMSVTQTVAIEAKIAGTAAYMSPEQAEGKPLDARSDIFSFGAVLYEMIAGRQPFLRQTQTATFAAILRDDPPPPEGAPPELAQLVARCLRKDPERRFQHLVEAKILLEEIRDRYDPAKRPHRRSARLRHFAAVGLAAAIAGAAITAHLLTRNRAPAPAAEAVPFTTYLGNEVQPSFSPDGKQVAFVWDGERQDNADIYVKMIGGAEAPLRLTTDAAQDLSPAWSPDGRFIAFVRNQASLKASVLLVPALGGPERLVCELGSPFAVPSLPYMVVAPFPLLAWTPDGKGLIVAERHLGKAPGLSAVTVETGEKSAITSAPPGNLADGAPAVSADGRTLLFSRAETLTASELYRVSLGKDLRPAGQPQRLTFSRHWNASPAWLPDGEGFVFARSNWYLGPAGLRIMTGPGDGAPFAPGGAGQNTAWPAVSAQTHRLIFSRALSNVNIWRIPLRGGAGAGAGERLIASTQAEAAPQYSPDGKRIAFTSTRSGAPEVWVSATNGSGPVQLTSLRAPVTGSPHWSPDGQQIVFDSNPSGKFDVYAVKAAGGSPRRLTEGKADNALASFARDGSYIYFSSNRTGRWEVWKMPAGGGNAVQVTAGGGRAAVESADGRRIYYEREYALWSMPASGGAPAKVLDSVGFLNWAVSRDGVYFLRDDEVAARRTIEFFAFASRRTIPVLDVGHAVDAGMAVSPDGSSLLFTNVVERGADLMLVENFR